MSEHVGARSDPVRLRYTNVAIALHWLIALAIAAQIVLGLVMTQIKLALGTKFELYQLHKSIGICVLLLVALRLLWRLTHRPPPLPGFLTPFERQAASSVHVLLYVLMIGMPLTGWALVSASRLNIPTLLFGVVRWPHLPVLPTLPDKAPVEAALKAIHAYGGWFLIGILVLHVGGALRHQFIRHDGVLLRMLPGRWAARRP